jgi:hypothetical protein
MKVNFDFVSGKEKKLIGTISTTAKGKAAIEIPEEINSSGGAKGVFSFMASFNGFNKYKSATAFVEIRNVNMELSFYQKEGEKEIICKAMEVGQDGKMTPLPDLKIQFYVPRTFTLLKVGEGSLSDGVANVEFPVTLPGDSAGNLTIVAKIEDNESYGNVEATGRINWGKPLSPMKIVKRGLGDTDAPLWMVYTLIILLSLVWFHYCYIIITVFRIRWLGKNADYQPPETVKP